MTLEGRAGRPWLGPLIVFLAALLVYANTIGHQFTWDDQILILDNPRIGDPAEVGRLFLDGELWRPLKRLSLTADYLLWGRERPGGFHLTSIVLHALACLALYFVARRLGLGGGAAATAGMLFAVHPVHVESVANISHRKEAMALLFGSLALLAWQRARVARPAGQRLARAGWVGLAGVCYLLGMLSKEVGAVMVPFVALAWEIALGRREDRPARGTLGSMAVPFVLVLALFTWRGYLGTLLDRLDGEHVLRVTAGKTESYPRLLLMAVKAFGFYGQVQAWPSPLYVDRQVVLPRSLLEPGVLLGLALLAAYAWGLWQSFRRSPRAFVALAWYGLHLLPVLNLVPLTHWLVAERFVYVPSAGVALLLALATEGWWARRGELGPGRRALALGVLGLVPIHACLTVAQNRVWRDNWTLYSHTLRFNPGSARAWNGLAFDLMQRGRQAEAEPYLVAAIAAEPDYPVPHLTLGVLRLRQGRLEEALAEERKYLALKDHPSATAWLVVATAERRRGQHRAAARAYREAGRIDRQHAPLLGIYARLLATQATPEQALEVIELALGEAPDPELERLRAEVRGRLAAQAGRDGTDRAAPVSPER